MLACPLCNSFKLSALTTGAARRYFTCTSCSLIFLHPEQRLSPAEERARYTHHQNSPSHQGYRDFLAPLVETLLEHVAPGQVGLDFGSGPGPALPTMFAERGFEVAPYDPFFAPDPAALETTYDFIACSETVEHLFDPRSTFERLNTLLKPCGWLGVMTQFFEGREDFIASHYHRDPTHVCFYGMPTFGWIAKTHGWRVTFPTRNTALFHKSPNDRVG